MTTFSMAVRPLEWEWLCVCDTHCVCICLWVWFYLKGFICTHYTYGKYELLESAECMCAVDWVEWKWMKKAVCWFSKLEILDATTNFSMCSYSDCNRRSQTDAQSRWILSFFPVVAIIFRENIEWKKVNVSMVVPALTSLNDKRFRTRIEIPSSIWWDRRVAVSLGVCHYNNNLHLFEQDCSQKHNITLHRIVHRASHTAHTKRNMQYTQIGYCTLFNGKWELLLLRWVWNWIDFTLNENAFFLFLRRRSSHQFLFNNK